MSPHVSSLLSHLSSLLSPLYYYITSYQSLPTLFLTSHFTLLLTLLLLTLLLTSHLISLLTSLFTIPFNLLLTSLITSHLISLAYLTAHIITHCSPTTPCRRTLHIPRPPESVPKADDKIPDEAAIEKLYEFVPIRTQRYVVKQPKISIHMSNDGKKKPSKVTSL